MVRKLDPEKRERFLRTALSLFVENGVQDTSTAEIARQAGTAAGTLFLYFASKQDLIDALVLKIAREQSEAITARLAPDQTARETFFTIWQGSIHWFLENMDAYQYNQQVRDTALVTQAVVQESGQYLAYYFEAVQKGRKEGSIKPYPVEVTGGFLYQDIVAVMNILKAQPDTSRQEEIIQMGFDIFWDGIQR
jgi:AcrR family transcriptional regulator